MPDSPLYQRPFVVTEGGPTYLIEKRLGLIRQDRKLTIKCAGLAVFLTWVPLLVLTILQHNAWSDGTATVPFLKDFAIHARFLVALPLLILAESVIGPHLGDAASHFVTSGVVIKADYERFESAVERGLKWRDSYLAEILILALALGGSALGLHYRSSHFMSWTTANGAGSALSLTWAGWWYVVFCIPVFQFFCLRWLWRLFLWGQFLWRLNHFDLKLVATHPDQAGGLGFLGEAQHFFGIVLFAFSVGVAGVLANNVIYGKTSLHKLAPVIAVYVLFLVFLVLLPMALFSTRLLRTKREGLSQYGSFAMSYTAAFQQKWIAGQAAEHEELLGTADIQSLADLGNSFELVEKMNPMPIRPRTPIQLAVACLVPMVPLLLTVMSLGEVVKMLVKIVM